MARSEEEMIDIRDAEGNTDKWGNYCIKVGDKYVVYTNAKGTYIVSKKIPAFRYMNVRRCKRQEDAMSLFASLESQNTESGATVTTIRDNKNEFREKIMSDETSEQEKIKNILAFLVFKN